MSDTDFNNIKRLLKTKSWFLTTALTVFIVGIIGIGSAPHAFADRAPIRLGKTGHFSKTKVEKERITPQANRAFQLLKFTASDDKLNIHRIQIIFNRGEMLDLDKDRDRDQMKFNLDENESTFLELRHPRRIQEILVYAQSAVLWGTKASLVVDAYTNNRPNPRPEPNPRPSPNPSPWPRPTPSPEPSPWPENPDTSHLLECQWNGANNQPYDKIGRSFVGKSGHGFKFTDECNKAVQASRYGVVCNWTGNNYSPYRTRDSITVGKQDYGFTTLNACNQSIQDAEKELLCNWTGNNYSPYRIQDSTTVGTEHYGTNAYSACVDLIHNQNNGFMCNWNGSNYQPYVIRSNDFIGKKDFGFTTAAGCNQAVQGARNGNICNWNGDGTYARFEKRNPSTPVGTFRTLQDCSVGN